MGKLEERPVTFSVSSSQFFTNHLVWRHGMVCLLCPFQTVKQQLPFSLVDCRRTKRWAGCSLNPCLYLDWNPVDCWLYGVGHWEKILHGQLYLRLLGSDTTSILLFSLPSVAVQLPAYCADRRKGEILHHCQLLLAFGPQQKAG